MANADIIKSYLVSLGFSINDNEYQKLNSTLQTVAKNVQDATKQISGHFIQASAEIVGALGSITAGTAAMVDKVIMADMKYQNMALTMHMSVEATREMDMALKAMGTTIEGVAWNPEQRQQYFALLAQQRQMSVGQGGEQAFKDARNIRFEFVRMKLEAQYALMWISYMLIEKLGGPLGSLKTKLSSINDYISSHMPQIADKIANWIIMVLNLFKTIIHYIEVTVHSLERLWSTLSKGEREFAAFGAIITAFFLIGPLGKARVIISGFLLLLDDFYAYMDGRKSSSTLAPVWRFLIGFTDTTGPTLKLLIEDIRAGIVGLSKELEFLGNDALKLCNDALDTFMKHFSVISNAISKGIEKNGVWANFKDTLRTMVEAIDSLVKGFDHLLVKFGLLANEPKYISFWDRLGDAIGKTLNNALQFVKNFALIGKAIGLLMQGDFKGAADVIMSQGPLINPNGTWSNRRGTTRSWGGSDSDDFNLGPVVNIQDIRDRIGQAESGGNYDSAGDSSDNLGGKYQILGSNWSSWASEAGIGGDAPYTPENQDIVAQFKMQQMFDDYKANNYSDADAYKGVAGQWNGGGEAGKSAANTGHWGGEAGHYPALIAGMDVSPASYTPSNYSNGLFQASQNYQSMVGNAYYTPSANNGGSSGASISVGDIHITESPDGKSSYFNTLKALQDATSRQTSRELQGLQGIDV